LLCLTPTHPATKHGANDPGRMTIAALRRPSKIDRQTTQNKSQYRGKFSTSSNVVSKNQRGYTNHHIPTTKTPQKSTCVFPDPPQKTQ
jgi:hypothetical protein